MIYIMLCILIIILIVIIIKEDNKITENERENQKSIQLYEMMCRWYINAKEGKSITNYFIEKKMTNIAIYGKGKLGKLLYNEIKDTKQINSICWVDKYLETSLHSGTEKIINIADVQEYKDVDALIITPVQFYDEIELELTKRGVETEIVSLEDIIYMV